MGKCCCWDFCPFRFAPWKRISANQQASQVCSCALWVVAGLSKRYLLSRVWPSAQSVDFRYFILFSSRVLSATLQRWSLAILKLPFNSIRLWRTMLSRCLLVKHTSALLPRHPLSPFIWDFSLKMEHPTEGPTKIITAELFKDTCAFHGCRSQIRKESAFWNLPRAVRRWGVNFLHGKHSLAC